jgi:hypothetical protein
VSVASEVFSRLAHVEPLWAPCFEKIVAPRAQLAAEQAKTVAAHEADEKIVALRAQLHTPCKLVSGKKRSLGELRLGGGS